MNVRSMQKTLVRLLWSTPGSVALVCLALVCSWALTSSGFWLLPIALLAFYFAFGVSRRANQISELHLATIEALALAIDAKDQTAHNHIRRVQVYAVGLARAIGMSEHEIRGVKTAALLHDIGKLAVPEHILAKPGPLTPEEFQKVRIHPQVGAGIISAVPFPYPVAPLILSHHERWDGRGYPAGLRDRDIPLGARVLSIVDYFDALTSERPYHQAMSIEGAVSLLQQEAGKALDPQIVETFVRVLPQLRAEVQQLDLARLTTPVTAIPTEPAPSVFDDIALAHREIYALYQIAQTMGTSLGVADTMGVICSKLSELVPFSSCALFLHTEATDSLRCRFATGVDAETLEGLTVRDGQGLSGWVARNRRPLVNARPAAELEAAASAQQTKLQSALVCPLIVGDRFIGTLSVYHVEPSFYRDDHRRLLDRVCEQAAAVIHNSMVFEQTQEDSLTDALTGLPNTRFMFLHLSRELARADRLGAEVSLMVMDLDDFKEINDTFGHHIGDRALREVATVLRTAIRPYDICVRYAGDEFIVVLSGCGREEAETKRQELQHAVDNVELEVQPDLRIPMMISVGAAVFPHDGDSYETLLAKADSRMYRDKSQRKAARARLRSAEAMGSAGYTGGGDLPDTAARAR
ncbi:MAG TPA: diguanylate cyclase [Vicinamibacterales bacterium]|nr:diguanylate cyclase [Vicinamibacterales bacterium]